MQDNIRELTDKIYREGIEKAEEQGRVLVQEAKEQARLIVAEAEKHAADLIAQTEKECAESKKRSEAEMRLAAQQALSNLKQKITDLLIWKVTSKPIRSSFQDQEFIQRMVGKLIDHWLAHFGLEERLEVLLPEKDFDALQLYFQRRAQEELQKGIILKPGPQIEDGFQISPEDGRFKVSFSSTDFENYFKTFARPGALRLLFGEQTT
jgi:V/A-type H+-transporting ATPase subunit E